MQFILDFSSEDETREMKVSNGNELDLILMVLSYRMGSFK